MEVRIASPCPAAWEGMQGTDRERHCATCRQTVYDLSAMSAAEANELVLRAETEPTCVRLHVRADGTVLTNDCWIGAGRARLRARIQRRFRALAGLLASAAALVGWRAREIVI